MAIDIFMTSFHRFEMTLMAINLIHERTAPGSFSLHVYDNGSDRSTQKNLHSLLDNGKICSLVLDSRNTGCSYNKPVFYAMAESTRDYFCVTDNDVYPPKLEPDWLSQMIQIMDRHPDLGFLAPQLPPQRLQQPYRKEGDIVLCRAVGNTLKLIRKKAFPIEKFETKVGEYGDDGLVCQYADKSGWKSAFCRNIFCYHAGQTKNWGYEEEQLALDPRKKNYGPPFVYKIVNDETYEPEPAWRI